MLKRLFEYDASRPLAVGDTVVSNLEGATLHAVTYSSPKGGSVAAWLVVPKGKGPFAAVLFGHWGNGTMAEFIPEAKLYARVGVVSLLPDYPWDRAPPSRKDLYHFDKPELDREVAIQAVTDLRRGIDLLVQRSDVDASKVAYVGHSFGAQWVVLRNYSMRW